jgi:hypothetical protein
MRYKLTEGAWVLAKFDTGSTVTLTLYKLSDSSSVTLASGSMAEIGTTGVFKWNTSNITTQPTAYTEYLWIATDGTLSQYGKVALGGYPDNLDMDVSDAGLSVAQDAKLMSLKNAFKVTDSGVII